MASSKNSRPTDSVLGNLRDKFGTVLEMDIIKSVAEQCNFDVQKSSHILLEMSNNAPTVPKKTPVLQMARKPQKSPGKSKKTIEFERIVGSIKRGLKVLVILRGLPGSGKSSLASRLITEGLGSTAPDGHILSTDDFFYVGNRYQYNPSRISEAHDWNQNRAFTAMSQGFSPVIIDNTNVQMWEMKPYAMMATDYGYIIEVLEPATSWVFNEAELARRNTHGVPRMKIKEMLQRYDYNITPQKLLSLYNLAYKFQKPPQYRLFPPIFTPVGVASKVRDFMDFTDHDECINKGPVAGVEEVKSPVDDLLMCKELGGVDEVLAPMGASLENAWGIDPKVLNSWELVTPISAPGPTPLPPPRPEPQPSRQDAWSQVNGGSPPNGLRVLTPTNRDINAHTLVNFPPIRRKMMMDQSCDTQDFDPNIDDEETRIKGLMDLFPKIPRASLVEVFERCNKDFDWTVDLLLEDVNLSVTTIVPKEEVAVVVPIEEPPPAIEVPKRRVSPETTLALKKALEKKFEINKEHYSDHVLKVKESRFGAYPKEVQVPTSAPPAQISSSSSEDDEELGQDPKNFVELNLGEHFVRQLETLFHSEDVFPQGLQPVVQVPKSLARELYTFYVESICRQMENQNQILTRLVKEDEEFAVKLQFEGCAQKVPDLLEIMDEQAAQAVHKKEIDEWKNMTADNLAMRLTKQKLFQTFPGIPKDDLLEIWHAYDYDYEKTVEDLKASVGLTTSSEDLTQPPISPGTLAEMKDAESISAPEEFEDDKPAAYYREEANKHLKRREALYDRARAYHQKGMTEVAVFYSELAQKATRCFDQSNNIAAAKFAEDHSHRLQKFDTLDLHYLYVKEAIPQLDIFLDRNINLLQNSSIRAQDLFIITGRGKNSIGGISKIKPAVINHLHRRQIAHTLLNPGLLKIRITRNSFMTNDFS